ncbi:SDR family NAD(P)-dependent oxidoreductase [Pacificimonas sp. ICDLI1SI03]
MHPDDIMLRGKSALVTGGANGIGKGIALALARFGADVAIADIDSIAGPRIAGEIAAFGPQGCFIDCDVMKRESLKAAVDTVADRFGRFDILVNNAGGGRPVSFLKQSERSYDRHIELNLNSMLNATRHAAGHMIVFGNGGSIINISSIEGLRAGPGYAVYSACKAAMLNFTKSAALELAEHEIRVNAIAPDIVATEGFRNQVAGSMDAEEVAARARYIPMGRDGDEDDCAGTAVFLASRLARYVTGTTINVDGGTFAASGWMRTTGKGWRLFPDRA